MITRHLSELPKLELSYEELKTFVIEKIKEHESGFEFNNFLDSLARQFNAEKIGRSENQSNVTYDSKLSNSDKKIVREIIWDLIIQRVLSIGSYNNDSWPHLSVTEYGMKIINNYEYFPHDPSKYIERVKGEIPNIDEVILNYLRESISTYNINQLLSASITLGCASEKALLILIEKYTESFEDIVSSQNFERKIKNRMIKIQFEEFQKSFTRLEGNLPKNLMDNFRNILLGVFEMIREQRNLAGHPTGHIVNKEMLFANFQVFVPYCKRIYQLIDYFEKNKHI